MVCDRLGFSLIYEERSWQNLNDLNMLTSDVLVHKSVPSLLTPKPFLVKGLEHPGAQNLLCTAVM